MGVDRLTNEDFGLQIRLDPTSAGQYVTLDEGSDFTEQDSPALADGQTYGNKGHDYQVAVNKAGSGSFQVKQVRGTARLAVRGGTVALVRWTDSDGYGEKYEVIFESVERGRPHNNLPTFSGRFRRRSDVIPILPAPAVEPADPAGWAPYEAP